MVAVAGRLAVAVMVVAGATVGRRPTALKAAPAALEKEDIVRRVSDVDCEEVVWNTMKVVMRCEDLVTISVSSWKTPSLLVMQRCSVDLEGRWVLGRKGIV